MSLFATTARPYHGMAALGQAVLSACASSAKDPGPAAAALAARLAQSGKQRHGGGATRGCLPRRGSRLR